MAEVELNDIMSSFEANNCQSIPNKLLEYQMFNQPYYTGRILRLLLTPRQVRKKEIFTVNIPEYFNDYFYFLDRFLHLLILGKGSLKHLRSTLQHSCTCIINSVQLISVQYIHVHVHVVMYMYMYMYNLTESCICMIIMYMHIHVHVHVMLFCCCVVRRDKSHQSMFAKYERECKKLNNSTSNCEGTCACIKLLLLCFVNIPLGSSSSKMLLMYTPLEEKLERLKRHYGDNEGKREEEE